MNESINNKRFTILGGGLVGSLLSIYLRKRHIDVQVFEKRGDIRANKEEKGRSINMALSDRGWLALDKIGLIPKVKQHAIPMYGRMIHQVNGEQTFQAYGEQNQAIYSISRNLLTQILVEESISLGTHYSFNQKCTNIDLKQKQLIFQEDNIDSLYKHGYDVLIGTDGAFSEVRLALTKTDRFDYEQFYLHHGYKELNIPALENGSHKLEKHALHIWPRGHFMLIALPNMDGSFTCTLFLPFEGIDSFQSITNDQDLFAFFSKNFSDAIDLMPTLLTDYFHNPTSSLMNVKCKPWSYQDSVLLMGDAAHSIVPFYGQGMNAGFEDVRIFGEMLENSNNDLLGLFEKFQSSRKPNTDAISQMAIDNFAEMRDKVGDQKFQLKKKIDAFLHERYREKWIPQYSLVTFSPHISYSEALRIGEKQSKILDKILEIDDIEKKWQNIDYFDYL